MMRVAIRGGGTAAAGCAHLLARAGVAVAPEVASRPGVPAVMLSDTALALLRDVFDRPSLFADRPRIARRVVHWGQGPVADMPHGATLVDDAAIWAALGPAAADACGSVDFTIETASAAARARRFGDREAVASPVRLRGAAARDECRVEAVASGWLFLMPDGAAGGTLLAIGGARDRLLGESRWVAKAIDDVGPPSSPFPAMPRIGDGLVGDRRLACGSAAIGFDPICGDGAAQSVREAILAAAVVAAIAEGAPPAPLLDHYRSMLVAAMRRHLLLCMRFYRSGGSGPWWQAQLAALDDGFNWCTRQLATAPAPRFELHGFRLVPRRMAA